MAECIIARGGGRSDGGSDLPPIVVGYCSIVVAVSDSEGTPISDLSVHCKDGDNWYNYHTNDKGQTLFVTNSGSANITAWNFSINGNYKWIDQQAVTMNIDAPASSSNRVNISLSYLNTFQETGMSSNIYSGCYTGNYKFRASNRVNAFIGGAGGGSGPVYGDGGVYSGGGGSGGLYILQIILRFQRIKIIHFILVVEEMVVGLLMMVILQLGIVVALEGLLQHLGLQQLVEVEDLIQVAVELEELELLLVPLVEEPIPMDIILLFQILVEEEQVLELVVIGTARDKFGGSPYGGNSVLSTYSNRTPVGYGQDGRGPGGGAGANVSNGHYTMRGHTGGPGILSFTFY